MAVFVHGRGKMNGGVRKNGGFCAREGWEKPVVDRESRGAVRKRPINKARKED